MVDFAIALHCWCLWSLLEVVLQSLDDMRVCQPVVYSGLRRSCITEAKAEVSGHVIWPRMCICDARDFGTWLSIAHCCLNHVPLTSAIASVMQDLRNPLYDFSRASHIHIRGQITWQDNPLYTTSAQQCSAIAYSAALLLASLVF